METKNLLNKKITQWLLLVAMLVGCSANAWAWSVPGEFNNWNTSAYFDGSSNYSVNLTAGSTYSFKIENNSTWYGNNGTMDRSNCSGWTFSTSGGNCKIKADVTGTYVFHRDNDTPTITVTYPKLPDPEYYVTGNAPGAWGTWYKMTKGSNANEYYYDMPNTGEFKFSNKEGYENEWYKTFSNTGTVTGVTLKNGPADNAANCNLSNIVSGYTFPIRFWINVSTKYIWATATEVTCTAPTSAGYTLSSTSFTYSGSGQAPTVTPKSGYGTPSTIKYGTDASGATTTKPTNVGTYHVYITGAASGSYCAYTNLDLGTFTISCANPTAAGYTLSPTSFTYSGSGQAPTVSPKSGYGTPSTTKYGTSTSSATTTKPTNIGTYHVYITGGASGNYCAYTNLDLGTFTISCANPTSAGYTLSSTSFTYSGSAQGPTVSPKTGYGSPTTTKYGTSASSATTTKPTNAGTYHVYITGAASGNYCAYTNLDLGTFTINQKTPTSADFTWDSMASYDGNPKSANVAWKSGTGSGTITTKYNGSTTQPSAASEYTLTIDVAAAGNYGVASNINLGKFTISGCSAPTITTLPQVSPNQNIDYPKVISARYRISGGTCDITSAGVNVYLDASCTNKKYELTNSASGSTAKDTDIAFDVTLKENTIYYVKAFVTLDGGSTIESTDAQTYFTFPVLPTTTGAENTDCGKFVAKASTDLTSKEDGGTAKFSSYSVTFRVWDNDATVTGYGTPTSYYTKTASSVSGTEASATFNIASVTRYDDKTTKMQMGSTYKYIAYYTLSNVAFSDRDLTMFSRTYRDTYAPKSFTIPAPSITPDVNSITFDKHVVLGQEGDRKQVNYTFCGHNFTTSDFALTGTNATDFAIEQQSVGSGTASVKIKFTPKSGIGVKTANLVVKEGGNVISTIPVSATADCITPTKANYSVSGNVHTYDGTAKTAVITPNSGDYGTFTTGTATYGGQASQTIVGNYTIHYNVPDGGNYCAANFDFDEKLTINKATLPDITGLPTETVTKCSEETEQLTPALGGAIVGAVSWSYSSSAPGVATVSDAGLITAVGAGDATITVTASATGYTSKDATVTVHVNAAPSLILTGTSPKGTGVAATYPWEYMTITATCTVTPTWDLTGTPAGFTEDVDYVVEGSDKVYKIKAKQTTNEDTDKFTFTVTATADNGCSTVMPFDVYINAAPAEDCGK